METLDVWISGVEKMGLYMGIELVCIGVRFLLKWAAVILKCCINLLKRDG